jgi:hypothetical protein
MYIAISNVFYAGILWGFYVYVGGEREKLIPGVIMATACYLAGMLLGFACAQPKQSRPLLMASKPSAKVSQSDFDELQP